MFNVIWIIIRALIPSIEGAVGWNIGNWLISKIKAIFIAHKNFFVKIWNFIKNIFKKKDK